MDRPLPPSPLLVDMSTKKNNLWRNRIILSNSFTVHRVSCLKLGHPTIYLTSLNLDFCTKFFFATIVNGQSVLKLLQFLKVRFIIFVSCLQKNVNVYFQSFKRKYKFVLCVVFVMQNTSINQSSIQPPNNTLEYADDFRSEAPLSIALCVSLSVS